MAATPYFRFGASSLSWFIMKGAVTIMPTLPCLNRAMTSSRFIEVTPGWVSPSSIIDL